MKLMQDKDLFQAERTEMVAAQIIARGVDDERVCQAMRTVPRHVFLPQQLWPHAYEDNPLPIGHNQTISQPYIVALMTSLLNLNGDEKVLEIGTGSGYQAAILGSLAAEVHSIERIPELAAEAEKNLEELGYTNILLHRGDGSLGWPQAAPYDGILVTAGAPAVPKNLLGQLKRGGRLVVPVGERKRQMLQVWINHPTEPEKQEILPVVFVPLKGAQGWQDSDW